MKPELLIKLKSVIDSSINRKKILFSIFFAILCIVVLFGYQLFTKPNYEHLNLAHRIAVRRILDKFDSYLLTQKKEFGPESVQLVSYDSLLTQLNYIEKILAIDIFDVDSAKSNLRGTIIERSTPYNLVKISSSKFVRNGDIIQTGVQFFPLHACRDFNKMMIDMRKETEEVLFVSSGYHSKGYQAYLFIKELVTSDSYSIKLTAATVSLPGYSEHEDAKYPAIDLISRTGLNGYAAGQRPEDFENLKEVKWLFANAQKYNFYLSYPKNNHLGLKYEPCHWRWVGQNMENIPEITQGN